MRMSGLSAEDLAVVAAAQRDGVAVLRDLLSPAELQAARRDHETAHVDAGNGTWDAAGNAATRSGAGGDQIGQLPGLARLYTHPRIVGIVGAIMGASPWIHAMTVRPSPANASFCCMLTWAGCPLTSCPLASDPPVHARLHGCLTAQ